MYIEPFYHHAQSCSQHAECSWGSGGGCGVQAPNPEYTGKTAWHLAWQEWTRPKLDAGFSIRVVCRSCLLCNGAGRRACTWSKVAEDGDCALDMLPLSSKGRSGCCPVASTTSLRAYDAHAVHRHSVPQPLQCGQKQA